MLQQVHKGWTIQLLASQQDNGSWACPYMCHRSGTEQSLAHRQAPPGLWETKEEAEAASLAHATAWIDAQK